MLPAASVARTENVCSPSARVPTTYGDVHAANSAASSLHSNVEFASLDENVNGLDADVIEVSGAAVSTVKVRVAGVWSMFPAASVART